MFKKTFVIFFLFFLALVLVFLIDLKQAVKSANNTPLDIENISKDPQKYFAYLVNSESPRRALDVFADVLSKNDSIAENCHPLVHKIGREAYKKYQDFGEALGFGTGVCAFGYTHGVIEQYFVEVGEVDLNFDEVCKDYPYKSLISWECYHGVGHGLMLVSGNELFESIDKCKKISDEYNVIACLNGVFMENFNPDQDSHPSKFVDDENLFYPCNTVDEKYKHTCYLYAPTHFLALNNNQFLNAINWCKGAEEKYIRSCAQGVGNLAMEYNIGKPVFVEQVCNDADELKSACIKGLVTEIILHYGSVEKTQEVCDILKNRLLCEEILEEWSNN